MQEIELYDCNVSAELLGASGVNRTPGDDNHVGAVNDADAVRSWLSCHGKSAETLRKYTREARRIVIWSVGFKHKPLSSLRLSDMQEYREFLLNPPPELVGARSRIGGREWRPFAGERSEKTVSHAMVVLLGMFTYLTEIQYLKSNPMAHLKEHLYYDFRSQEDDESEHLLDEVQIAAVKQVLDRDDEPFIHRTRFAIALMLFLGMRINEVTNARMGKFRMKKDGTCWIRFLRKGSKWQTVPVPDALLVELRRYRLYNGLSEFPELDDETPLLLTFKGSHEGLGDRAVRSDCKAVFARAAELVEDEERKQALLQASPHWLRHVFATRALRRAKSMAQAHQVQKLMNHKSLKTTMIYDGASEKEAHEFVKETGWET